MTMDTSDHDAQQDAASTQVASSALAGARSTDASRKGSLDLLQIPDGSPGKQRIVTDTSGDAAAGTGKAGLRVQPPELAPLQDELGPGDRSFTSTTTPTPSSHRTVRSRIGAMISISTPSSVATSTTGDGSTLHRNAAKKKGPLSSMATKLRGLKFLGRSPGIRNPGMFMRATPTVQRFDSTHRVAFANSPQHFRTVPLPKAPKGYTNLGEYVQHHRKVAEVERNMKAGMAVIEEEPNEEQEIIEETPDSIDKEQEVQEESRSLALALPAMVPPGGAAPKSDKPDESVMRFELHAAARLDDAQRCRFLAAGGCGSNDDPVGAGAVPVDILNEEGETAAVVAARCKCVNSCAALLNAEADPLARDSHPNIFGDSIWPDERKPDPHGVFMTTYGPKSGRSVIYHLRLNGLLDEVLHCLAPTVRVMVVKRIAESMAGLHHMPAMRYAAMRGQVELCALLLSHPGASAPSAQADASVSSAGGGMRGAASSACRSRPATIASLRADSLLVACMHRYWNCAELIVAAGVQRGEVNRAKDRFGRTALHVAASEGHARTVRILLVAGASHSQSSDSGRQPLHEACAHGRSNTATELIKGKADIFAKVHDTQSMFFHKQDLGMTPFDLASQHGHAACATLTATGGLTSPSSSLVKSAPALTGMTPRSTGHGWRVA